MELEIPTARRTKYDQETLRWFAGSKILTPSGEPQLLLHGRSSRDDRVVADSGFFLTPAEHLGVSYAGKGPDATCLEFLARCTNPAEWSIDLLANFQDWLHLRREEDYKPADIARFDAHQRASIGEDAELGEDAMDSYVLAALRQTPRQLTFSDTDPILHFMGDFLQESGHDGLWRNYEISDHIPTGDRELIVFDPKVLRKVGARFPNQTQ